jgi:hypothetical protein
VAQASYSWQQFFNQVPNWMLPVSKIGAKKQRSWRRYREPGRILGFLTILVAMLLWNWKLVLALLVGVGAMSSVYSIQGSDWRYRWKELSKLFQTQNRRLSASVLSGAMASIMTYMGVAIWLNSENGWVASAIILQGLVTMLTLGLLVWLTINLYGSRDERECDTYGGKLRMISQLADNEPLKRLIAIRQLTKMVKNSRLDEEEEKNISEYLQLLLTKEQEKIVREAAFEGLQVLDGLEINSTENNLPLQPLVIKKKTQVSHQVKTEVM